MSAADPVTAEPPRFSIRLPRPVWIGVAAGVLFVTALSVRIGVPIIRQQAAIRKIEGTGGTVKSRPWGPQWLRKWLGDPFFVNVVDVTLEIDEGVGISDAELLRLKTHLAALPQLTTLSLAGSPISDAGLEGIEGLSQLEHLNLGSTGVTDAGLQRLAGLKQLKNCSSPELRLAAEACNPCRISRSFESWTCRPPGSRAPDWRTWRN